jgi:hypothetical protein
MKKLRIEVASDDCIAVKIDDGPMTEVYEDPTIEIGGVRVKVEVIHE